MTLLTFFKKKQKKQESAKTVIKKSDVVSHDKPAAGQALKERAAVSGSGGLGIDLQPLITEKSVRLQEQNVVTFRVAHNTTKGQVAHAMKDKYQVVPKEIRMLRVAPKRRRRGATVGATASWKKAYVKVDDVQALNISP